MKSEEDGQDCQWRSQPGVVGVVFALSGSAHVHTKTTTTSGKATQQVKVDRAEKLVLVAGNRLGVEDG